MSKYGEFAIVRTERHKCKRSTDPNADEDGMREYSFLSCPHCIGEVEILSDGLKNSKSRIIRDHIAVCPAYNGDRPVKRCVEAKQTKEETTTLSDPNKSMALVPFECNHPHHDKLSREMDAIRGEVDGLKEEMSHVNEENKEIKQVVAQHHVWWKQAAELMGLQPPQDPPVILDAVKLLTEGAVPSSTLITNTQIHQQQETFNLMTNVQKELSDAYSELSESRKVTGDKEKIIVEKEKELSDVYNELSMARKATSDKEKAYDALKKRHEKMETNLKAQLKGSQDHAKDRGKHSLSLLGKMQQHHKAAVKRAGGVWEVNASEEQKRARSE